MRFLVLVIIAIISSNSSSAKERIALVIGNSTYEAVSTLNNPERDADAIARAFRDIGFNVTTKLDVSWLEMRRALKRFGDQVHDAEIAVIYFSGHGMEFGGKNWLVPVDAKLASDSAIEDEAISLDYVLGRVYGAKTLSLIILDACRNNPFISSIRSVRGLTKNVSRGLARVEPEDNILVAYAAKHGTVALDGKPGDNSPYAKAWLRQLSEPGRDIRFLLGSIRDHVTELTGKLTSKKYKQVPFHYGTLPGHKVSLAPEDQVRRTPPSSAEQELAALRQRIEDLHSRLNTKERHQTDNATTLIEFIIGSKNCTVLETYINQFPNGTSYELAFARWKDLQCDQPQPSEPGTQPSNKFKVSHDTDLFGGDYEQALKNVSYAHCERACRNDMRCEAFTYDSRNEWCFRKNGSFVRKYHKGAISGTRESTRQVEDTSMSVAQVSSTSFSIFRNWDFTGMDIYGDGIRNTSFGECKRICQLDKRCKSFSWVRSKQWCWPKHEVPRPVSRPGIVSGVKE